MARSLQDIYDEISNQAGGAVSPPPASQLTPQSERLRTAAQGFTFGFADEIEGFVRSILPGGREYEVERDELRKRLAEYKQANPYEALTAETAGAIATMFIPGLNVAKCRLWFYWMDKCRTIINISNIKQMFNLYTGCWF